MRWFRMYSEIMHDPKVQKLPAEEFRHKLLACVDGEQNEFSRFIRVSDGRVFAREWADIRSRIFERDDFTCAYCGQRGGRLECDHIIPVSRGGATTEQNLTTSCFSCNRKKRDKTAEEWRHSRA